MLFLIEFKTTKGDNLMLNVAHISKISSTSDGNALILLNNGVEVTVGHNYKEVMDMLNYYDYIQINKYAL